MEGRKSKNNYVNLQFCCFEKKFFTLKIVFEILGDSNFLPH